MATGLPRTKWRGGAGEAAEAAGEVTLCYPGKRPAAEILATPPAECERLWGPADPRASRLYFGDNLPILASLRRDPAIVGQVQLIYIDPPFSTGAVFQSRQQEDAYRDTLTGPVFLEFLRARLVLLRELLAPAGSIYVHLDERAAFQAKLLLDEIFGSRNYRNWLVRLKSNPKNASRRRFGNVLDYVLFYTRSDNYYFERPTAPWAPERLAVEYPCVEPDTGRRYKKVPVHAPGERNGQTGRPWRGKLPPPGKHWQLPPAALDALDARGEIYWSPTGNPRRKLYADQSPGVPLSDLWLDLKDAHNQHRRVTDYPTEKNPDLLRRILRASSRPGDLVLDCFAGSGTTLAVAAELGRRWIGVDQSPIALRTILRRLGCPEEPTAAPASPGFGLYVSHGARPGPV